MAKRKSLKREAGPTLPPQIHHHQQRGYVLEILVSVPLFTLLAVLVIWFGPVFLLEQAGVQDPSGWYAAVLTILLGAGAVASGGGFLWLALWSRYERVKQQGRIELARLELQRDRENRLAHARPIEPGRMLAENERKAQVVLAVMWTAYEIVAQRGRFGPSDPRPWSKSNARGSEAEGGEITYTEGQKVGAWVRGDPFDFVTDRDQLDLDLYPDYESVRQAVQDRWGAPPVVGAGVDVRGL